MKAEMAVRSISASISAWAARTAPRTISRVTGSHRAVLLVRASGIGRYWRRSRQDASQSPAGRCVAIRRFEASALHPGHLIQRRVRTVLQYEKGPRTHDGGEDQEVCRRHRILGRLDQPGGDERREAAEQGHRHAVAD